MIFEQQKPQSKAFKAFKPCFHLPGLENKQKAIEHMASRNS
jgi:hypothetical protein